MTVHPTFDEFHRRRTTPSAHGPLTVALVNNMPDGALRATERQFRYLVARASPGQNLRFQVYYFPETLRGAEGRRHCDAHYRPIDELLQGTADALIVTGCEPRAPSLKDEPFWGDFTRLVDWAKTGTRSALWSCLAAHAAVLHLDGIERHHLGRKLSGVFACDKHAQHPLLAGLPANLPVPHSRFNTLRESDLVQRGYTMLTGSPQVGPDTFIKAMPSLFVFLQGHPEYEPDSLGREFRRDLERFLTGESVTAPGLPQHYFDPATEARFAALQAGAAKAGTRAADLRSLPLSSHCAEWRQPATVLYKNWLDGVASMRADDGLLRLEPKAAFVSSPDTAVA